MELLIDIDILLIVENGIRGRICHAIHRCAKANNEYMNNYDKNKELSSLKFWDINNLCGWAMSQKSPLDDFKWVENTSQFNQDFIKSQNEHRDQGYFIEADIQYLEELHNLHND